MSAGQEFWIVAGQVKDAEAQLKSQLDASKFSIIDGHQQLHGGTFESLVGLTDDLAKADNQVDTIVHRIERQYSELDAAATFQVNSQAKIQPLAQYINNWQWDDAKYPRSQSVADNLKFLMSVMSKMDEDVRAKLAQYTEAKSQRGNIAKKDTGALATRDLIDLLTPDKVTMNKGGPAATDDFISTEHLATVCVILAKGGEVEFLKGYESFSEHVIPGSAKKFNMDDKDGNQIWRVVVMRVDVDNFKKGCREHRFVPRDFEYSAEKYAEVVKKRADLEIQCADQLTKIKDICKISWSDAMIGLLHVKAMRVFVECVLRFGMPPNFSSFVLSPKNPAKARLALAHIMGSGNSDTAKELSDAAADEGEEYFPYVSVSFTPLIGSSKV